MSKAKAYTKMILERLQKKTQFENIKSSQTSYQNSNLKTQATPSDHRGNHNAKLFFQSFEAHCAVYHQPVYVLKDKKSMRRPLVYELKELQLKSSQVTRHPKKENGRMRTEAVVSEFKLDEPKRGMKVMSKDFIRENKSVVVRKIDEKPAKSNLSGSYINRYKSLKTLPSKSSVYSEPCSYRRILVSPSSLMPIDRRQHVQRRQPKYQRKRQSPKGELIHRCQSYERYLLGRV